MTQSGEGAEGGGMVSISYMLLAETDDMVITVEVAMMQ